MLRYLEKAVCPRRPTPPEATKRVVGIAGLMLSARLILTPIPLSNILPALIIALISFGLYRGGWISALDQSPGRIRRHCCRPSDGLADCPWRRTDQAPACVALW